MNLTPENLAHAANIHLGEADLMMRRADSVLAYRCNLTAAWRTYCELGDNSMLRVLVRDATGERLSTHTARRFPRSE